MGRAVLLLILTAVLSQASPPKPPRDASLDSIKCNHFVLRFYLLKGRPAATSANKSLLCPTITHSCCTAFDEQRAFHFARNVLTNRMAEYQERMRLAFSRFRQLHKRILQTTPSFKGSDDRVSFCRQEFRRLENTDFEHFFELVSSRLDALDHESVQYFSRFYCLLCDARNHRHIQLVKATLAISVDSLSMKRLLEENLEQVTRLNVELVNLMQNMQSVVDCFHYDRLFRLPFFSAAKESFKLQLSQCLAKLSGDSFLSDCQPVFQKIRFAAIMPLFEGDFEFINLGTGLLDKLLGEREQRTFVSNDLRAFYKSFVKGRVRGRSRREQEEDGAFFRMTTVSVVPSEEAGRRARRLGLGRGAGKAGGDSRESRWGGRQSARGRTGQESQGESHGRLANDQDSPVRGFKEAPTGCSKPHWRTAPQAESASALGQFEAAAEGLRHHQAARVGEAAHDHLRHVPAAHFHRQGQPVLRLRQRAEHGAALLQGRLRRGRLLQEAVQVPPARQALEQTELLPRRFQQVLFGALQGQSAHRVRHRQDQELQRPEG